MTKSSEPNPFDYDADARDRLWRWLEMNDVDYRDQLKQSAGTAGAELEFAKPSLLGGSIGDGRFYAGPAVMVASGTAMIVLAYQEKVFTISLRSGEGHTFIEAVTQAIDYVKELVGDDINKWSGGALAYAVEDLIKKYGWAPGQNKNRADLDNEHNVRIIGMLLMPLPDAARTDMINAFQSLIDRGICPAWVGLLGKGSREGLSMVWPLPLALAPYADTIKE